MLVKFAPETDGYREPGKPKQPEASEPSSEQWQPEDLEASGRSYWFGISDLPEDPVTSERLENFHSSEESEKWKKVFVELALAVYSADMADDAKGLNCWIAILGSAYSPAVDSSLFGMEEPAELLAENAGDAAVDFQYLLAAVFDVALAVVAASLAIAQRRESGLLKNEKPDSLEQAVSVTLEPTLGTANLTMEVGFGDYVQANRADLRLIQESIEARGFAEEGFADEDGLVDDEGPAVDEGFADDGELVEERLGDEELAAGDRLAAEEDAEGPVERFAAKWLENLPENYVLEGAALELEDAFDAEVEPGHVLELGTAVEVEIEAEAEAEAEVGMGSFVMERNAAVVVAVVCY